MQNSESHFSQKDRELLIRIDEKVRSTQDDIKSIFEKIANLEARKVDTKEIMEWRKEFSIEQSDHETRIRRIESDNQNFKGKWAIVAVIAMFLIGLLGSFASQAIAKLFAR